MIAEYMEIAGDSLQVLRSKNDEVDKLTMKQLASVLYCGYGRFYKYKNDSHIRKGTLTEELKRLKAEDEDAYMNLEKKIERFKNSDDQTETETADDGDDSNSTADADVVGDDDDSVAAADGEENLIYEAVESEETEDAMTDQFMEEEEIYKDEFDEGLCNVED